MLFAQNDRKQLLETMQSICLNIDNIPPGLETAPRAIDFVQEPVSLGWFRASTNLILLQQNGGITTLLCYENDF